MLYLDALEVIQLFRKPGGDEFTGFCNKLIRASCAAGGVPQSAVTTCSRTDAKDGGVDTRVEIAVPRDKSGYFTVPTIWQYKAADESNIAPADMHVEVNKKHARQRIEENHGYRLCVCDHLTDEKKQSLLAALQQTVAVINKDAPPPMILSVEDLVETANRFPALVLQYRPHVDAICVLFHPWSQSVTAITPEFVAPSGFDATKAAVLAHVDFAKQVHSPVLTLYGTPGADKTRTLFACLRDAPAVASLVLYTSSEDDVLELANVLRNQPGAQAIVIADDCSIATGEKLVRTLMGFRERIRCVCVDNNAERVSTPSPELVIPKMAALDLENVLRANFKQIPYDRIRAYAAYCDGSVRLAADMCAHYDAEIAQAGTMSSVLARIDTYYRVRLANDGQREAVEAIALLKRVKYKGEAPTELDLLCDLTNIQDKSKLEQTLAQLKDSPGWIEKGALYYRVTPAIIAMTAFESGWTRWEMHIRGHVFDSMPRATRMFLLAKRKNRQVPISKNLKNCQFCATSCESSVRSLCTFQRFAPRGIAARAGGGRNRGKLKISHARVRAGCREGAPVRGWTSSRKNARRCAAGPKLALRRVRV